MCLPRPLRIAVSLLTLAFVQPSLAAQLVRDINPPFQESGSFGSAVADLPNVTLLFVDDGVHGTELYATDGTPAGTRLLLDINPGPATSDPTAFTVINGVAYFWADDGTNGVELWRSDGTTAGTFIVANIGVGSLDVGGSITFDLQIATLNGVVYFNGDEGQAGAELWRSDGTRAGTYRLADINPGPASSVPVQFTVAGSRVFFLANDGVSGVVRAR